MYGLLLARKGDLVIRNKANILKTQKLTYRVGEKILVQDISINIENADLVSIIGPNGSGKSTLVKLISGELKPYEGNILFQGKSLEYWDATEIAKYRAVLPQSNQLSFPFSVLDIVKMGRYPYQGSSSKMYDENLCIEILNIFDLTEHIKQNYITLSGGERQRVQLARIFAQIWSEKDYYGKLLILDEPTSYLDIKHQYALFDFLKSMNKKGLAIIMVLHDLNHAAAYSDKVIMLKESKLIVSGEMEDVFNEEKLKEVFEINLKLLIEKGSLSPVVINLS